MKRLTINIPNDRGRLYDLIRYPAGEIQVRLTEAGIVAATGIDEYVIEANPIPDFMELAQLKDALDGIPNKLFYRKLELMYLPYARADRRFTEGDSFGLGVFGRLINSLGFTSVTTFDVHSRMAAIIIPNLINIDPIHDHDQIADVIRHLGPEQLVLIAPDKGAKQRYDLDVYEQPVFTGEKVRDPQTGKLSGFFISPGIVNFPKALIVDDICDGGGTFIGLAKEIHKHNPGIELSLYVSHGIFSKGLEELWEHFDHLYVSDYSFKFPGIDQDWETL